MIMTNYEIGKKLERENLLAVSINKNMKDSFIQDGEKFLNVVFPKSYLAFLKDYGFCSLGGREIYGIIDNQFEDSSIPDAIWLNYRNRTDFDQPEHIIVISDVGEGSYYALDLSQMNDQQECPVVIWPSGGYEETPELEIVAPDFGTWFLNEVKLRIALHKEQEG